MTTNPKTEICDAIHARQRFLISSHARPDGDSIGSQLAMAYALVALGKEIRIVNADPAPDHYMEFPGVDHIEITRAIEERDAEALIVMESGDLKRTGVAGLEGRFTINIDHHQGNTYYGNLNWIDLGAAACGEMVYDLIVALGVPLTIEVATHVYLAILTDTGSFHYSNITPKTFEICRQTVEAGVSPATMARRVFDQNSFGKLKLIGALLAEMELLDRGRLAVMYLNDDIMNATGTTYNDTEGLINLPLTAREIHAVVFFKLGADGDLHVSMRSKYDVDVRAIAARHGGGGHKNAAGFKTKGPLPAIRQGVLKELADAIELGVQTRP
ncbi:MAG TPA: bifunctional oligoribonuclease/PAP phosphatase NrnA [Vicinamibacterales bacterium]|nr:bifunctional oligoribonuclease/PAP phosphatase NrnA [Vicinamibacterales bacterium]